MKEFDADNRFFAEGDAGTEENVAVGETVEQEEPKEDIPDELAGISEETAREIMAEANETADDEGQEDAPEPGADADSDNKQYPADGVNNQRVPYGRFKEELDKKKELEEQNKQLQAQLAQLQQQAQAVNQPPAQQAAPQNVPPSEPPKPQINKEAVEQINAIVKQQAMQMTGLTQDDLDDMEFMDDDDPRKQSWKTAYDMSRLNVYNGIQQIQTQRVAQAKQFLQRHEALVKDYNEFAQAEMNEPDYQAVMNYATNDFFENGISKADQPAIAEAYARIEKNVASPGDIALIKRYYKDAKAAYRSAHPAKAKPKASSIQKRVQQAKSFPRASQVEGAADTGGNVTVASLQHMFDTMDWDDIPEKYRKMLLQGYITE